MRLKIKFTRSGFLFRREKALFTLLFIAGEMK